MSGGNNQASAQRRTSAKDPLCIGFASCSACFRTESWRQKGAASQPLAPGEFNFFLGKGFFLHLPLAPGPLGVREREPTPPADPLPEWTQYRGEQPNSKAPHNPPPSVKPTKAAVANLLSRYSTSPNRKNDHLAHQGLPRRDHQIFPASSGASLQGSLHVPPSSSAKASSLFSPSFLFGTVNVWFLAFSPCFLFPCV